MAGFTKLSSDIVDSSIWDESAETCKVWITLLALADAEGYVRGSEGWLAGKSRVSLGKCVLALNTFQSADIRSRNPQNDGKRIEKTDNGWKILNYSVFRETWEYSQKPSAVRMRQFRERHIPSQSDASHSVTPRHLYASASDSVLNGKGCGENQPTKEMALIWLDDWKRNGATYTQQEMESAFLALQANGWMWGKNPVVDFRAALERQIQTDRQRIKKPLDKVEQHPDWPPKKEVELYAKEKDDKTAYWLAWYDYWSKKDFKRGTIPIDWKVEFSRSLAKHLENKINSNPAKSQVLQQFRRTPEPDNAPAPRLVKDVLKGMA